MTDLESWVENMVAGDPPPAVDQLAEKIHTAWLAEIQPQQCNAAAADCACSLRPGHDEPHHCPGCGGQWTGTWATASFDVITLPGLGGL